MVRISLVILLSIAGPAYSQLHLITGSPMSASSMAFGSSLLRIENDGSVSSIAEFAANQSGASWITVSYDLGIAIIQSDRMTVVDLEKAHIVKACRSLAAPAHTVWVHQWLLNLPARGGVLVDEYANSQGSGSLLLGTVTNSKVACGSSGVPVEPSDLRYISILGQILIGDVGDGDGAGLHTHIDESGNVKGSRSGLVFSYGYQIPATDLPGIKLPCGAGIPVNNAQIMVVIPWAEAPRAIAVRKRDNTFHSVPLPITRPMNRNARIPFPIMRGFGHFIAMAEARPKDAENPESAGRSEWRRKDSKTGPNKEYSFLSARSVFPGRLHLYDVETERSYTIRTNQGDSEIVLVEDDVVYYRVSNRVYVARISEDGIGPGRLLATDEAIRDAHWAFLKH